MITSGSNGTTVQTLTPAQRLGRFPRAGRTCRLPRLTVKALPTAASRRFAPRTSAHGTENRRLTGAQNVPSGRFPVCVNSVPQPP